MFNETGAILIQMLLYFAINNNRQPPIQNISMSFLDAGITDPFFENETIKCYDIYGCYPITSPWNDTSRPISIFPESPSKVNPRYCLHTRYNLNKCQYLNYTDRNTIFESFFTPFHKTYLIVHGFLEDGERPWMKNISKALLHAEDANVILIDWGSGSLPPYTQAVANIRLVGRITAMLLYTLKLISGANIENMHIIGHSLGAHLSGYVGFSLQHYFNETLGRITGMDPAEPHFSQTNPIVRLDPTDALFVDIIHTNAKPFIMGGLGMDEPIGHLDFYPNSGDHQPGCDEGMMKFIKKENESMFYGLRKFFSCDHVRSHEFFLEAINSDQCKFYSVECDTWENFLSGKCFPCRTSQNQEGVFCASFGMPSIEDWQNVNLYRKNGKEGPIMLYTITSDEKLFCQTLYRITITISNSPESIEHKGEIGIFSISINGTKGRTNLTEISKEQYLPPGSSVQYVIGGKSVGTLTSAKLYWEHRQTMNVFTWRFDAIVYVGSVTVETFTDGQRLHLCPLDKEVLGSRRYMKLKACPE